MNSNTTSPQIAWRALIDSVAFPISIIIFVVLARAFFSTQVNESNITALIGFVPAALIFMTAGSRHMSFNYSGELARLLRVPDPYASIILILFIPAFLSLAAGSFTHEVSGQIKVFMNERGEVVPVRGSKLHNPVMTDIYVTNMHGLKVQNFYIEIPSSQPVSIFLDFKYSLSRDNEVYRLVYENTVTKRLKKIVGDATIKTITGYDNLNQTTILGIEGDIAHELEMSQPHWLQIRSVEITRTAGMPRA